MLRLMPIDYSKPIPPEGLPLTKELYNDEYHRDQDERPDHAGNKPAHSKRGLGLDDRFPRVDQRLRGAVDAFV